jgi:hypothetical protein
VVRKRREYKFRTVAQPIEIEDNEGKEPAEHGEKEQPVQEGQG